MGPRLAASYSRSASRTAAKRPLASASAVWSAAPLPRLRSWKRTRTCSGQLPFRSSSRVPSVEPSSTITSSRELTGSSVSSASLIAASTVARSL